MGINKGIDQFIRIISSGLFIKCISILEKVKENLKVKENCPLPLQSILCKREKLVGFKILSLIFISIFVRIPFLIENTTYTSKRIQNSC